LKAGVTFCLAATACGARYPAFAIGTAPDKPGG